MKFASDTHEASVENTTEKKSYFNIPSLLFTWFFFLQRVKLLEFSHVKAKFSNKTVIWLPSRDNRRRHKLYQEEWVQSHVSAEVDCLCFLLFIIMGAWAASLRWAYLLTC